MPQSTSIKVRLTLKGRLIRDYDFSKPALTIGRDPGADICLDNIGVSRAHAKIENGPEGWWIEDAGSANGTYLNDAPVQRARLRHNDVIGIGKFTIGIGLAGDPSLTIEPAARSGEPSVRSLTDSMPDTVQGTTILTRSQLAHVMAMTGEPHPEPALVPPVANTGRQSRPRGWIVPIALIVLGLAAGIAIGIFLL